MAIRKNKKFIDPRYFMDEKTDVIKEEMGEPQQADSFSSHLSLSNSIRDAIIGHLEDEGFFEMGAIPQSVIRVIENSSLRVTEAVEGADE